MFLSSFINEAMLSVLLFQDLFTIYLLLPGIQGNFLKMSKTKQQTGRQHPAQHASITLAPKGCDLLCAEVSYCDYTCLVKTASFSSHKIFQAVGLP